MEYRIFKFIIKGTLLLLFGSPPFLYATEVREKKTGNIFTKNEHQEVVLNKKLKAKGPSRKTNLKKSENFERILNQTGSNEGGGSIASPQGKKSSKKNETEKSKSETPFKNRYTIAPFVGARGSKNSLMSGNRTTSDFVASEMDSKESVSKDTLTKEKKETQSTRDSKNILPSGLHKKSWSLNFTETLIVNLFEEEERSRYQSLSSEILLGWSLSSVDLVTAASYLYFINSQNSEDSSWEQISFAIKPHFLSWRSNIPDDWSSRMSLVVQRPLNEKKIQGDDIYGSASLNSSTQWKFANEDHSFSKTEMSREKKTISFNKKNGPVDDIQTVESSSSSAVSSSASSKGSSWNLNLDFSLGKNFHQYETSENGRMLIQYSFKQGIGISYSIPSWNFGVGLKNSIFYTYSNQQKSFFEVTEYINWSVYSSVSLTIGHSNSGSVFKSDGVTSNVELINKDSSVVFFSGEFSF